MVSSLLLFVTSDVKSTCNARRLGLDPKLGRSPGGRNDSIFSSILAQNPMEDCDCESSRSQELNTTGD